MTVATREEVMDAEIVRTSSEWAEVIKGDLGRAVEGIVSAGRNLIAAKADVAHGEWLPMLREIGIDRQTAHRLMGIGRNPAITNVGNYQHFPTALRALAELSRMDPDDIEHGIEAGAITPDMTIREAREYAQPEPPAPVNVDPATGEIHDAPPPDEERVRRAEATYERLRNEGVIPPPPTDEELRQSVYDLIGNKPREPRHLTPEDKFAKALNAVGAAIRINHGVNEALLDDDGWAVLQALGLR